MLFLCQSCDYHFESLLILIIIWSNYPLKKPHHNQHYDWMKILHISLPVNQLLAGTPFFFNLQISHKWSHPDTRNSLCPNWQYCRTKICKNKITFVEKNFSKFMCVNTFRLQVWNITDCAKYLQLHIYFSFNGTLHWSLTVPPMAFY